MDNKNDNCELEVIDKSPVVNLPYCRIFGDDYDCVNCKITDKEKDDVIEQIERYGG